MQCLTNNKGQPSNRVLTNILSKVNGFLRKPNHIARMIWKSLGKKSSAAPFWIYWSDDSQCGFLLGNKGQTRQHFCVPGIKSQDVTVGKGFCGYLVQSSLITGEYVEAKRELVWPMPHSQYRARTQEGFLTLTEGLGKQKWHGKAPFPDYRRTDCIAVPNMKEDWECTLWLHFVNQLFLRSTKDY